MNQKTRTHPHISHSRTRKHYVSKLKSLYPRCIHDNHHPSQPYNGQSITYGEMTYKGMRRLFQEIQTLDPQINTFIDIGSGRGKLCLYLASHRKILSCLGIELVKERCEDAVLLKSHLRDIHAEKVQFICENVLQLPPLLYMLPGLPTTPRIFVWISNLCFDQEITDNIFQKLLQDLTPGTIITCSKPPSVPNTQLLRFLKSMQVEMSWNTSSNVHIFQII
jgi:hypothetical protein